jgi:hypothetical protein
MGRINKILTATAVGAGSLLLLGAARAPSAISSAAPGLWELSGMPNAGAAARQCVASPAALARIEHRGQNCSETVVSDTESTTLIHYTCRNGEYGQTKVTLLTPRSLRIETQGISENSPFNYKIQARRVGECPAH